MYNYDGHDFGTLADLLLYVTEKFGETGGANATHVEMYGTDLAGGQAYLNGTVYAGKLTPALKAAGLNVPDALRYLNTGGSTTQPSWDALKNLKTAETAVIENTEYTNGAMQLGSAESPGGSLPTMTKPISTENGSIQNSVNGMFTEAVENPEVPGTFSYIGTLGALGWLPMPAWTAAVAPALGVALGVGAYDLNPEFWEGLSRTLLPYAWMATDGLRLPFMMDENDSLYVNGDAIEALKNYLVESGVYSSGSYNPPTDYGSWEGTTATRELSTNTYRTDPDSSVSQALVRNNSQPVYCAFIYTRSNNIGLCFASTAPFEYTNTANQTTYQQAVQATVNDKNYYVSSHYLNYSTGVGKIFNPAAGTVIHNGTVTTNIPTIGYYILFGTEGGGIPGATPESGATYPTASQTVPEIYPNWAQSSKNILMDPTADTYENAVRPWYPVSLSNTNYSDSTDNTYSTGNQAGSQTGTNTNITQLEQIVQGLQDLIESLTESGTVPSDPTVPTDPTGNTPSPTPPMITGAGSDLIAIYNPTKSEIQAFNQFLWSLDPTNLTNWKKVIANPIDAIISLSMIYVTPITGERRNIKCGYIETDVTSNIVTNQYVDVDCGTVTIAEYFHNVWDYIGTKIHIYLPFIGIVPLNVGEVMASTLRVRYKVDVYTGTCLAQIIVSKGNSIATLYTYAGNCAVQLPLTSGSFSGILGALLTAGGVALFGGGPAMALGGLANTALNGGIKQDVQRSGNIGANAGAMGIRVPYVIITRNKPLDAYLYNEQYGYPANKTVVLGNLSGYTRVKSIHLQGIPCTDDELEMIERELKDGVIFS